ncbi:MAG: RdgB/HAM1 family non-canonical purine NTP pyrophosphatase [Desulfovibrionaceae bacterium]|nr:RdgB/HAM1 family non-canonical purine NTP pyrophosphatase [Desulfovibrionaceae bacterium]
MSLLPLVLATRNPGKVRELAAPLALRGFAVQSLPDAMPDVEESGSSFEENALLKARAAAAFTGLPALADDSGLEVDALGGAPGVRSARYADDAPDARPDDARAVRDERNNRKLLRALADPALPRAARFRCCMALVWPGGTRADIVTHGAWEGSITHAPRGGNGFGYDPVFLDPASGRTGAELTLEEKKARSHRGKALARLLEEMDRAQARNLR